MNRSSETGAPRPVPYPSPSRRDPVARVATGAVGGPPGRHTRVGARGSGAVAATLVALGAAMLALGVFQKGHCVVRGWANPDQFWRTCYSDVPVLHVTTPLADRVMPYLGEGIAQPPGSGLAMWLLALVTPRAGTDLPAQQWVFGLWALAAVVLLAAAVIAAVALRPRNPWQAAHLALAPVLVPLALVSTTLLAVALAMVGLLAFRRARPAAAGALLGGAVLTDPTTLVLLAGLALVAVRAGRRWSAAVLAATALGVVALVTVVLTVLDPEGGTVWLRRAWSDDAGYGALALVPGLWGTDLPGWALTAVELLGWGAALLVGGRLALAAPVVPPLARVAAPMLLIVLLTSRELPVQASLWVLPLLALSGVSWRDHLLWAGAEAVHFVTVWMHIGFASDPGRGLAGEDYAAAVLLRAAALAWVLSQATRTAATPDQGRISSLPVVPPDSRSAWAREASASG